MYSMFLLSNRYVCLQSETVNVNIESMLMVKDDIDDSNISGSPKPTTSFCGDQEITNMLLRKRPAYQKRPRIHGSDDDDGYHPTNKAETKFASKEKPDVCDAFATYVATQMRSLPRTRQLVLQSEIQNAITKQFLEWESENDQIESTLVYVPWFCAPFFPTSRYYTFECYFHL